MKLHLFAWNFKKPDYKREVDSRQSVCYMRYVVLSCFGNTRHKNFTHFTAVRRVSRLMIIARFEVNPARYLRARRLSQSILQLGCSVIQEIFSGKFWTKKSPDEKLVLIRAPWCSNLTRGCITLQVKSWIFMIESSGSTGTMKLTPTQEQDSAIRYFLDHIYSSFDVKLTTKVCTRVRKRISMHFWPRNFDRNFVYV